MVPGFSINPSATIVPVVEGGVFFVGRGRSTMLREIIRENEKFQQLETITAKLSHGERVCVTGLAGSLMAAVFSVLQQDMGRLLLFVASDHWSAETVRDDAQHILGPESIAFHAGGFRTPKFSPAENVSVLHALVSGTLSFVVTHAQALLEALPSPEMLRSETIWIETGSGCSFGHLLQSLNRLGFEKKDFVESVGDYSVRGGILDVFTVSSETPVRLEFIGDIVESIREFDPTSQRSIRQLEAAAIVPHVLFQREADDSSHCSLLTYLPQESMVVRCEPQIVSRQLDDLSAQHSQTKVSRAILEEQLAGFPQVWIEPFGGPNVDCIDFKSVPQPSFNGSVAVLRANIHDLQTKRMHVAISCDAQSELKRLRELLGGGGEADSKEKEQAEGLRTPIELDKITFIVHSLHEGFILPGSQFAMYTEHQIFGRLKRRGKQRKSRSPEFSREELQQLRKGDFVVHADFGVGKFDGLKKIRVRSVEQEVVKLVYDQSDTLYVNLNYINRVQKYSSREGHVPKLTRLGSAEWDRLKARAKKKIKDIARDLIRLYARRKQAAGFAFAPDTTWQKELEASFVYEDTFDQARTTLEVKADMEAPNPMDRLVCGDVGFGKTEIAVRAAFKSVLSGKQVAILVPTTILAIQHNNTFVDRVSRFSTRVDVLSRFKSKKEQAAIIDQLGAGSIDIVIGTHRLLSKDVRFKDLGLLVIDEEHRFGVAAKEKLRQLKAEVDTLTLTATPIPRTLQFSLMGSRDLSIIATPPRNRLPVITEIGEYSDEVIIRAVRREIQRGGQVYFVHDRIQRIEEVAEHLRLLLPEIRIRYAHGQMRAHTLEQVMLEFIEKKVDVLVCTKIIESGLDMPNVNTIIINRADRFGMAELYQLRGRVGRSNVQAYAYLLAPPISVLPRKTVQRLQSVEEFVELGSGFNLAMRDLEIRGAGNLLGGEQSGFIETMGFETYTRILEEAVQELKDQEFHELFPRRTKPSASADTMIDLDVAALIPDYFVQNDTERLEIYRQLYTLQTPEQLDEVTLELKDRFGTLPKEAENLIRVVRLKLRASRIGLKRIHLSDDEMIIEFPPSSHKEFYDNQKFQEMMIRVSRMKNRGVDMKQKDNNLLLKIHFAVGSKENDPLKLADFFFGSIFEDPHEQSLIPTSG